MQLFWLVFYQKRCIFCLVRPFHWLIWAFLPAFPKLCVVLSPKTAKDKRVRREYKEGAKRGGECTKNG